MKLDNKVVWSRGDRKVPDAEPDVEDFPHDILDLDPDRWFTPERDEITLPSALAPGEIERLAFQHIATIKFELHKGQVINALDKLCLTLGEKSL